MHVEAGARFTDPGVHAVDAVDGALSYAVVGGVNTSVIGVYSLEYVAIDHAGLRASVR